MVSTTPAWGMEPTTSSLGAMSPYHQAKARGALGDVTRWNSQFSIQSSTCLIIVYVASHLPLCLFWISLRLGIGVYKHPCFNKLCKIAEASINSDSNAQHFPFGFANTFMISLHALCTPRLPIPLYCHE
jgi:hypothetical protein